jgi:hypothetical protein
MSNLNNDPGFPEETVPGPSITNPREARWFQFTRCDYDPVEAAVRLVYRFDNGPELTERISFPYAPWPPEPGRQAAFERALRFLHLVAGVSYYKAGLSPEIRFADHKPDPELAAFLTELYVQGLAELAYHNHIGLRDRISFPGKGSPPDPIELLLPERALVAMGGGKDSLVGLRLLQDAGIEVQAVCVGGSTLIGDTVKAAGLPLLRIERTLAPELVEMNQAGAWNGHVPVTAINSAILLCASILYGFSYVVFSNERSADEATLNLPDGTAINHQYSKSSAFETSLREVIASHISEDIKYFSILRPFSELEIVRRFCGLPEFHPVYSSCNRNFHIDGSRIEGRWCLDCPKCRFAALSLALYLSPGRVSEIMGGDLLDQRDQIDGFRELCSLDRDKPFECVGETGESRAAMVALAAETGWRDHVVVSALAPELEQAIVPELAGLLEPSANHSIPASILSRLNFEEESGETG